MRMLQHIGAMQGQSLQLLAVTDWHLSFSRLRAVCAASRTCSSSASRPAAVSSRCRRRCSSLVSSYPSRSAHFDTHCVALAIAQ